MRANLRKILAADNRRRSRLHDGKGKLHLTPQMISALGSTIARRVLGLYPELPWLTYNAIAELTPLIDAARAIEFGAGTSTKWFARRVEELLSLENDPTWFSKVERDLKGAANAKVVLIESASEYGEILKDHPPFDIYLIDCQSQSGYEITTEQLRIACLELAFAHCGGEACFVIDNTDVYPLLDGAVDRMFSGRRVHRHAGWVPGIMHPNETTIVLR